MSRILTNLLLVISCCLYVDHSKAADNGGAGLHYWGVGIFVSDLERSAKFYKDAIGMKEAMRLPKIHEIVLSQTGVDGANFLTLILRDEKDMIRGKEGFGRIIVVLSDAAAVRKRVVDAGYASNLTKHGAVDPDGYVVEFYQEPAAK